MKIKYLGANATKGFSLLTSINRAIIPAQVSKIAESIQKFKQILRPVIIAYIDFIPEMPTGYYIIDGQHLYTACLRLQMDTPYIELSEKITSIAELIEKIALLNSSSKSWMLDDYIHTWGYYKTEYQEFMSLYNRYNIERTLLAELLHTGVVSGNSQRGASHSVTKSIKDGTFKIRNKSMAITVLDYVTDLRDITKDLGRLNQRQITSCIIEKIKADGGTYNHKVYKAYLMSIKKELILASNDVNVFRELVSKVVKK